MPEKDNYKIVFTELNDIVHFTPVASSFYEKEYIDEVAFYWLSDQRKYQLKHPDIDETNIQEGQYAQRRLAMWAYVYFVLHDKKSNDSWIEYETEAKKKMFRENVEDFKIIEFSYGQWNRETRIHANRQKFDSACEYNRGLNKSIIKLRKYVDGQYSTYAFTGLGNQENSQEIAHDILESKKADIENLEPIIKHYLGKYGNRTPITTPAEPTDDESFELFG